MQALDHAGVAAGELEPPVGERPGDAEAIGHRGGTEPEQMPGAGRVASTASLGASHYRGMVSGRELSRF